MEAYGSFRLEIRQEIDDSELSIAMVMFSRASKM